MAKPTTEVIALPDFPVTIVRELDGNFIHDDISLTELTAHTKKGLILYFYPKDDTPGCTTQATDFTANINAFDALGYDIIGADEKLCQYFDVIKEKNMYGKISLGLVRSAFVFDKNGTLTHAQRNLRAAGYTERLLTELAPTS